MNVQGKVTNRRTVKYRAAAAEGKKIGLQWLESQELYEQLQNKGYMWDSKAGEWLHLPSMEADDPSPLIKVRVWSELSNVQTVTDMVIRGFASEGFDLVEPSPIYPCRPPKQREGRIYLTFLPNK